MVVVGGDPDKVIKSIPTLTLRGGGKPSGFTYISVFCEWRSGFALRMLPEHDRE
jgi:hypothetical protein